MTMSDVARHAGVSRTTVSFVLNDKPGASIPDETRRRILEAIDELGYRPNAGARALAANRSGWFGLITEIVTGPFAGEVITGAQSRAWGDRRFLLIAASEGDPAQEAAALDQMLEHRVEGLLYATTWHRAVTLPKIAREVPTVLVNCYDADGELPCILPDEVSGGYKATRRLLDAGHTRIGFINLDPEIPAAIGRREGYDEPCARPGSPPTHPRRPRLGDRRQRLYRRLRTAGPPGRRPADRAVLRKRPDGDGRVRRDQGTWTAHPARRGRDRIRQPGTHRRLSATRS